ncbi:cytochrome b/b6 domain-containing protein [uncultured Ramlibacter sp.]|uniref:cytochrome b/b6 domain-containing protein n=1 Tax=uncultured Ramlibacter sp. TaxID=260755 RepID=UPI002612DACD|nr:cytochrome b/b6 domain-containing protein [uncultured Ramlibacter sp.]
MRNTVRVWDLPTRLFHWALAACVLGLLATAYAPGSWIEWHARLGYTVLALLLFRIVWGFIGGRWSRFAAFLYSPASVFNHLRGRPHPDHLVGHNPLGAGSVFAMLVFLLAQVATGLVSDDEIGFTGPLNRLVSTGQGLLATWYHKQVGQWVLIALVVLHVAAILYYLLRKKDNLVRPMLTGDKAVAHAVPSSRDGTGPRLLALAVLGVCAVLVWWLVRNPAVA